MTIKPVALATDTVTFVAAYKWQELAALVLAIAVLFFSALRWVVGGVPAFAGFTLMVTAIAAIAGLFWHKNDRLFTGRSIFVVIASGVEGYVFMAILGVYPEGLVAVGFAVYLVYVGLLRAYRAEVLSKGHIEIGFHLPQLRMPPSFSFPKPNLAGWLARFQRTQEAEAVSASADRREKVVETSVVYFEAEEEEKVEDDAEETAEASIIIEDESQDERGEHHLTLVKACEDGNIAPVEAYMRLVASKPGFDLDTILADFAAYLSKNNVSFASGKEMKDHLREKFVMITGERLPAGV